MNNFKYSTSYNVDDNTYHLVRQGDVVEDISITKNEYDYIESNPDQFEKNAAFVFNMKTQDKIIVEGRLETAMNYFERFCKAYPDKDCSIDFYDDSFSIRLEHPTDTSIVNNYYNGVKEETDNA